MGFLDKLFGKKRESYSAEDMILEMEGIRAKARYSRGHPVCPECGYNFPMTEEEIAAEDGIIVTICPKCRTKMGLLRR